MCYRPQPDYIRAPVKRPTNEELDRRFRKLEAELAKLRAERSRAHEG
jgi:ribosomal protein L29